MHAADAREVAARPGETGDQAERDRVAAGKTIGIVEVALFAASAEAVPPVHDHVDLAGDEVGGQCGSRSYDPPPSGIRSPGFAPRLAGLAQSLTERGHNGAVVGEGCRGNRSPASPSAAHARRMAIHPLRRRVKL